MKAMNVKRIAALGLGAALVGSALAPAVMAANVVDNLPQKLTNKNQIIDATSGAPVVDIVVGTMGQPADVIWAGNIAAKVAQMATTPTGSATASVDIVVGGTTSVSGQGEVGEAGLGNGVEFDVTTSNTKMPSLVNDTAYKYRWGQTSQQTTSLQETLEGKMDAKAQMQTGSTRYAVGELIGEVAKGDLKYKVTLGTSLNLDAIKGSTDLDSNSRYDLALPIFGKKYILDEITSQGVLVFYADTTPTDLQVGEKITVTPAAGYAGKKMEIQLVDLIQIGSGNDAYQPKWALLIDGVAVKYVQKSAQTTYNLKDEFGSSYTGDNVYVTAAGLNLAANKYTATIRTGSDRLEMKNGSAFPYTGETAIDNKALWDASFSLSNFTGFTISNKVAYTKTSGSENDSTKYVLKVGESINMPNDFAKFQFNGFQTKPSTELTLGDGKLVFSDLKGSRITVPFYTQFDVQPNQVSTATIAGQDYSFWFTDASVTYVKGKQTADNQSALMSISGSRTIYTDFANGDSNTVALDLGVRPYTGSNSIDVTYVVDVNLANSVGFLMLGPNTFDVYSKNRTDSSIEFKGTRLDNNLLNGVEDVSYYRPNVTEYLVDVQGGTYSDKNFYAARFVFNDLTDVNLFVRADGSGDVWNIDELEDKDSTYYKHGPSLDAENAAWGSTAIRDGTDYLQAAATTYGTTVVSSGGIFTLTVPEERRNVEAYLGSTGTSTTTTGGTSYSGVTAGQTKGNVTVSKINAATTGVQVTKVSNLVKADTDVTGAKSILVGGWMANKKVPSSLMVDGKTLESTLVSSGDSVAAVLDNGSIIVAGWTAADTGTAAQKLIAALDALV